MSESENNIHEQWEKRLRQKEARFLQLRLLIDNDQLDKAKSINYEHLLAVISQQNIEVGEDVRVEIYTYDETSKKLEPESEDGEFVEINPDGIIIHSQGDDINFSIPMEEISDIHPPLSPNY